VLEVDDNAIESLEGLYQLPKLQELSLKNNQISKLKALETLPTCPALTRLDLRGNPIHQTANIKSELCQLMPKLSSLSLMPVESVSLRERSAIGRFPAEKPGTKWSCSTWFQQCCLCCCRQSASRTALRVSSVDLIKSSTDQNRREHHTDRYRSENLIIRRGQPFQMLLELSRPFNPKTDKLHLDLKLGRFPEVSKGTHVIVPLVEDLQENCWEAKIIELNDKSIQLSVCSLPNAVIGRYRLSVVTSSPAGDAISAYNPVNDIYMLFNPWCKDDSVYLDNEEERKEYVLNDMGIIYCGTDSQIEERPWHFGQFDKDILPACLFLLECSRAPPSGWGDPVNVVRLLSAMINTPDDNGVLMGDWSGMYEDGTAPTFWSGSSEILRQYLKSGGIPVRYGQCWVFSGVTTSVLRCLGIPARSVTNFNSAHDTDASLTTDVYLDDKYELIEDLTHDAIWNFHVWNDCWMARPDLPAGMGGWQVIDATPQETSQGAFRCGPASVTAVRNGLVFLKHDTPFVFAEVNSDKVYWQVASNGECLPVNIEKNEVGINISTKAVGSDARQDITHLYKHPEDSEEERIAVETACQFGSKRGIYEVSSANDVYIEIKMNGEEPKLGADVKLDITVKNTSSEQRTFTLTGQVAVMYYTGVYKATVMKSQMPFELNPNQVDTVLWCLPHDRYKAHLVDQAMLMLTLTGRVTQTKQVLATQFRFRLCSPDLLIKIDGDAVVGEELKAIISFRNPLNYTLKKVNNIQSMATMTLTESFTPVESGPQKLLVSLDCHQLHGVYGAANITVQAA
ncbi:hypothetical protein DNTS_007055, partial [Danionella cerebrum]